MEEARRALFERVIRKYALAEVTKHRTLGAGQRNLIELISRYPSYGMGFKVFKKTWHEGCFWHVKKVDMFNGRYGRLWGYRYEKGELLKPKIQRIPGVLKRGMWQFDCTDTNYTPAVAQLDNGNQTNFS
mmetsp:Transcript_37154/g.48863  ORF Transcript_37154/g.48863 Transcript_37154/m.48863 type:complete len:129 (+) Transcript_37154:15-401(+)|eukprot:CAMPEP_0170469432 /NCGR_PEP_ID=MMETSP0123-20130129/12263_1 /TAXON_ID=182087 /ORGANISM="Favella ehrenbergii, Strain Fehren 1" /LENGTH=128 /DNA_ID=CAMNT_0010736297 /DNA_START=15 /DNA_END=401 /DNA_ORIENTATION=+